MCILIIHHLTCKSFLVSSLWTMCIVGGWVHHPSLDPNLSCLCKAQFHYSADTQPWPGQATTSCTAPIWIWSPTRTRGRLSAWYTSPSHWINIFVLILVFLFILLFLFSFWNFHIHVLFNWLKREVLVIWNNVNWISSHSIFGPKNQIKHLEVTNSLIINFEHLNLKILLWMVFNSFV